MDQPLFAGCTNECGNFYNQPNFTNLDGSCAECMASVSTTVGPTPGDTCLDSTCGSKILEPQGGYGYNSMDQWCKAAQCVNTHQGACPHYYSALFGGHTPTTLMQKAGCSTTETYCAGCAEGGYYNYYQLDNAYGPHILRR